MTEPSDATVLSVVRTLATALDDDDFDGVRQLLDAAVEYRTATAVHRGPDAVVASYREGSARARRLFDRVEYAHTIVDSPAERSVRVDFVDLLHVGDDHVEHHSVQDVEVGPNGRVLRITDRPVAGERQRLDEFLARHDLPGPG